jgi:hypothetical protein
MDSCEAQYALAPRPGSKFGGFMGWPKVSRGAGLPQGDWPPSGGPEPSGRILRGPVDSPHYHTDPKWKECAICASTGDRVEATGAENQGKGRPRTSRAPLTKGFGRADRLWGGGPAKSAWRRPEGGSGGAPGVPRCQCIGTSMKRGLEMHGVGSCDERPHQGDVTIRRNRWVRRTAEGESAVTDGRARWSRGAAVTEGRARSCH